MNTLIKKLRFGEAVPFAVVLGDSPGACLIFKQRHIPVAVVHDAAPLRSARYADRCFSCPPYDMEASTQDWVCQLQQIAGALQDGGKPVLFATSDRGLLAICKHSQALKADYVLTTPPDDVIQMLLNKVSFAVWAQQHNIPIPQSLVMLQGDHRPEKIVDFPMPCIVKPSYTFKLEDAAGAKLFAADTPEQMERHVTTCKQYGMDVVIQADLSRSGDIQWSLAGLCDRPGHLFDAVLARKLRQIPWGAGTATETLPMHAQILQIAEQVCCELNLIGLFEMELRPDANGQPFVIEINPRIWSQVRLPAVAGSDLLYSAYLTATNATLPPAVHYRAGIGWLSWKRDWRVSLRLLRRRELTLRAWIQSLCHVRIIE